MRERCVKAEPIQIDTAPTFPATAIPSQSSQHLMSPPLRLGLTDVETAAVTYCEPCHFLLIHRAIRESSKALCSRWLALQMKAINGNVAMAKLDQNQLLDEVAGLGHANQYTAGDCIYRIGEDAKGLYFISEGAVYLTTERHTRFAELRETDFFGESSLLSSGRHRKNVYAKSDCSVMLLDAAAVRAEVQRESPLVRLVLLNILNVLELMNQPRFKHLNAKKSGRPR